MREDHVLDEELPLWVPIQRSPKCRWRWSGGGRRHQLNYELKRVLRTGTVASTDNRNLGVAALARRRYLTRAALLAKPRHRALDMESATIAANGFRFRVPYGTLLCVGDKPARRDRCLGMATTFTANA